MSKPSDMIPADYQIWLTDLKSRIHLAQQRATLTVNRELITLYRELGKDILNRQSAQGWGAKVVERLSRDLRAAFPDMKGFSRANLLNMRAFAEAWPDPSIVQQAVGQLPWGHNILLITRLKSPEWRLVQSLPERLQTNLPSIEEIEAKLSGDLTHETEVDHEQ